MSAPRLILASASAIRRQILTDAGLTFIVRAGSVNENKIKAMYLEEKRPFSELASALALAKAISVQTRKDDIIIGADQTMEMDGKLFDKPKTMNEAKDRLLFMRGKEHRLIGAVTALQKTEQPWQHISTTRLKVRRFSEGFLDEYLEAEGEEILSCVGGYKFEGRGAQLFEKVEGDFFSILGLSLLPLLDHLRSIKAISS